MTRVFSRTELMLGKERLEIIKQKSVMVFGLGGVGGFAIQIAKHIGASVCTTASAGNHDYLRALGADETFDYRSGDLAEKVRGFAEAGVDLVFDCTGSDNVAANFDYVKTGGRVVTINGLLDTVPELEQCAKARDVRAGLVFVEPNGGQLQTITRLIEQNEINPLPVKALPMAQARDAQLLSQQGHVRGKLALTID